MKKDNFLDSYIRGIFAPACKKTGETGQRESKHHPCFAKRGIDDWKACPEQPVQTRHEFKYICTETMLAAVQGRISGMMRPDDHTNEQGRYDIRSLYFDDIYGSCYLENENGTDPREKFRIRIYNGSAERISLELKQKERGKTRKLSCAITQEQCRSLMRGEPLPNSTEYPPLLQKLLVQMRTRLLRPSVIVEYSRTPFVYQDGNVRITLDRNISASMAFDRFLEKEMPKRPIMEAGMHILEVKYDEFLPDPIHNALQMGNLQYTSFSKFYLCKKFSQ